MKTTRQVWFYVSSSNKARSKRRKAEYHWSKICIDRLPLHYKIGYFKSPQSGIWDTPFGSGLKVVSIHYFNLCGTRSCFTHSCFIRTRYVNSNPSYPSNPSNPSTLPILPSHLHHLESLPLNYQPSKLLPNILG